MPCQVLILTANEETLKPQKAGPGARDGRCPRPATVEWCWKKAFILPATGIGFVGGMLKNTTPMSLVPTSPKSLILSILGTKHHPLLQGMGYTQPI